MRSAICRIFNANSGWLARVIDCQRSLCQCRGLMEFQTQQKSHKRSSVVLSLPYSASFSPKIPRANELSFDWNWTAIVQQKTGGREFLRKSRVANSCWLIQRVYFRRSGEFQWLLRAIRSWMWFEIREKFLSLLHARLSIGLRHEIPRDQSKRSLALETKPQQTRECEKHSAEINDRRLSSKCSIKFQLIDPKFVNTRGDLSETRWEFHCWPANNGFGDLREFF